jgi:hypothetical protein
VRIKDDWFFQRDVEQKFTQFSNWNEKLVPIFERRDSYIESFRSHCFPVPRRRIERTFDEVSWIADYSAARDIIKSFRSRHFLSRAFRNRTGFELSLEWHGRFDVRYLDSETRRIIARRVVHDRHTSHDEMVVVCPFLLARFLAETRQELLWCVSSIRFTERRLREFRARSYEQYIKNNRCFYVRRVNPVPRDVKPEFRMESASNITGKRLVHEIERFRTPTSD